MVPIQKIDKDGNISSSCYSLQGLCRPFTIKASDLWREVRINTSPTDLPACSTHTST